MEPNKNLERKPAFYPEKQGVNPTISNPLTRKEGYYPQTSEHQGQGVLPQPQPQKQQPKKAGGKWTKKYKRSINCKKPKGFSQKQYCKYGRGRKSKKQRIRR